MKKRILAGLLALLLLTGCSSAPAAKTQPSEETSPETATTIPEPTVQETEIPEETIPETESLTEETIPFEVVITPVTTQPQTQVTVTTADEFLAAIAPNTEIILNTDMIDLSEATGYGKTSGEYYYWDEAYDGPEFRISGVSNLTIRGSGENHGVNVISSVPRYAYVILFENCSNIHTVGFTAGHTKEPGYCAGGVLGFQNCQDILVEDCGLFGCGTLGVMGNCSKNMQIINCDIYECSVGGVELTNCDDVNVDGCTFRDLGWRDDDGNFIEMDEFRVYGCGKVTCNGEDVWDYNPREMGF